MSAQQGIGKFVIPLLKRLGISVDGSTASALRLLGQITWPTGLGAIEHISGPSDQSLVISSNGTSVVLRVGGSNRFQVGSAQLVAFGTLMPATDGNRDLGTPSLRWNRVYAAGGTVPSVLHKSVTPAQTGADTDETTLWSYSLPAGILASDGQAVRIKVFGLTAANTNNKTITLKFGSTTLVTRSTSTSQHRWYAEAIVFRTGATSQVAQAWGVNGSNGAADVVFPAETLANAITIACTGQNGTASAGDIVFHGAIVEFLP